MLKKIFLFFTIVFTVIVNANSLDDKIENLLGSSEYKIHYKLLNLLFKDQENFYNAKKLKLINILAVLKSNGLLKLKYEKPRELVIEFNISDDPVKSLKIS